MFNASMLPAEYSTHAADWSASPTARDIITGAGVPGVPTLAGALSSGDGVLSAAHGNQSVGHSDPFTSDSPVYQLGRNFTHPQTSLDAFVPLSSLDLTTELTPNESDQLVLPNYTWNKAGFNISFNFTGNLSVSDWNTTETSEHHSINWLLLGLCIIPTWILFGNLLVLLAVIYHRNLRTLSNLVIASLAVTDFLLALVVVPFGTYQVVSE